MEKVNEKKVNFYGEDLTIFERLNAKSKSNKSKMLIGKLSAFLGLNWDPYRDNRDDEDICHWCRFKRIDQSVESVYQGKQYEAFFCDISCKIEFCINFQICFACGWEEAERDEDYDSEEEKVLKTCQKCFK